jgi:hypothetical protein
MLWLTENGHDYNERPAMHQMVSWKAKSGPKPIIFDGKSLEHFSCNEASVPFVVAFIEESKNPKEKMKSFDTAFELLTDDPGEVQLLTMRSNMVKPDLYAVVDNLIHELNMAIDEVNTMRDIYHTDNLTPADHWDKEGLHTAQLALREYRKYEREDKVD